MTKPNKNKPAIAKLWPIIAFVVAYLVASMLVRDTVFALIFSTACAILVFEMLEGPRDLGE